LSKRKAWTVITDPTTVKRSEVEAITAAAPKASTKKAPVKKKA
jgi:hypothetical protein